MSTPPKKQMTGIIAARIIIGSDTFICVVVVIYNLKLKRLYLHESFLTEKIPEIVASSLVRDGEPVSPQSQGVLTNILSLFIKSK